MGSPVRAFLLGAAAVLLVGLVIAVPVMTKDRTVITATPVPDPISPLEKQPLKPRSEMCLDSIPYTAEAARVRLLVPQLSEPTQPLRVRVRAAGLDESHTVAPSAYGAFRPIVVAFTPVKRESLGTVCVRNTGRRGVNIRVTSAPPNISRSNAAIDGKPYLNEVPVTLLARDKGSLIGRLGEIAGPAEAFKPGLAAAPVCPLLLLPALAVPALVLYAVAGAIRDAG